MAKKSKAAKAAAATSAAAAVEVKETEGLKVLLVGGGDCSEQDLLNFASDAFVIACDGGARYCFEAGVTPKLLIGDFDSLSADVLAYYEGMGVEISRFPAQKNSTDLELGMNRALKMNAEEIYILGAGGGRLDHTIANAGLLLAAEKMRKYAVMIGDGFAANVVAHERTFDVEKGQTVSFLPIFGAVTLNAEGLLYSVSGKQFKFPSTVGVSNMAVGNEVSVNSNGQPVLVIFTTE